MTDLSQYLLARHVVGQDKTKIAAKSKVSLVQALGNYLASSYRISGTASR